MKSPSPTRLGGSNNRLLYGSMGFDETDLCIRSILSKTRDGQASWRGILEDQSFTRRHGWNACAAPMDIVPLRLQVPRQEENLVMASHFAR